MSMVKHSIEAAEYALMEMGLPPTLASAFAWQTYPAGHPKEGRTMPAHTYARLAALVVMELGVAADRRTRDRDRERELIASL